MFLQLPCVFQRYEHSKHTGQFSLRTRDHRNHLIYLEQLGESNFKIRELYFACMKPAVTAYLLFIINSISNKIKYVHAKWENIV